MEREFQYAIIFDSQTTKDRISLVHEVLIDAGFRIYKDQNSDNCSVFYLELETFKRFLQEAEHLRVELVKPFKRSRDIDTFQDICKESKYYKFQKVKQSLNKDLQESEKYSQFYFSKRFKFIKTSLHKLASQNEKDDDYSLFYNLFSSSEQLRIIFSLINKLQITQQQKKDYKLEKMTHNSVIKYLHIEEKQITEIIPLHSSKPPSKYSFSVQELRDYFGDQVAQYFFFVNYMQKWLLYIAIIGCIVKCMNWIFGFDTNHSPFDSIYSLIMILWANMFCSFWARQEKKNEIIWRSGQKSISKSIMPNIQDKDAYMVNDPITGKLKKEVNPYKRYWRYLISLIVTIPIILFCCLVLVLSLNFRGYVNPDYDLIYFPFVSQFSQPDRMFDKNSNMSTLSSIMHSIIMLIINIWYSDISYKLTEKEMHKNIQDFNSSWVAKRFMFETFNTFTDLAYLGFYEMDIKLLKQELVSYYLTDEVRRLICESLIPYLQKRYSIYSMDDKKLERSESQMMRKYISSKRIEIQMPKYEEFDDYLEIIINFGYITLFASAFPLAPIYTLVFHYIEIKQDIWKLYNVYQRPIPFKVNGLGSWLVVMNIMSIIAVITNIVLIAFASHQIIEFFPWIFQDDHQEQQLFMYSGAVAKKGKKKYLIMIVFLIENVMLFSIFTIRYFIHNSKNIDWTYTYQQRQLRKMKIKRVIG